MCYRDSVQLSRRFFARPCRDVARALIGKRLVCGSLSGVIVETEAYLGPVDGASHARFGKTKRNAPMFGPPGHAYVYLCYGMYDLFNIVTGRNGDAQAVLIRALELDDDESHVARGPGKLTRALGISRSDNGTDLVTSGRIHVTTARRPPVEKVRSSPRIGIDYAGDWADKPLRYYWSENPAVSGPRGMRV